MSVRLRIENYRSLRDVTLELPVGVATLLVGENGAGKTNVLDALDLMRSAARGHLREALTGWRGGLDGILWRGGARSLGLALELDDFSYRFELRLVSPSGYEVASERLETRAGWLLKRDDPQQARILKAPWRGDDVAAEKRRIDAGELTISQIRDPEEFPHLARACDELAAILVYPPFDTRYPWTFEDRSRVPPVRLPASVSVATRLAFSGDDLVSVLYTIWQTPEHLRIRNAVESAILAAFPDFESLSFPPAGSGRVVLAWKDKRFSRHFTVDEISDGTIAFLCCLVALLGSGQGGLVALDEVDRSMHPELQYRLAGVLRMAAELRPVLATTHSDRLIEYVADPRHEGRPESVVVVEATESGSVLRRLASEELAAWLERYRLGELREMGELRTT